MMELAAAVMGLMAIDNWRHRGEYVAGNKKVEAIIKDYQEYWNKV